MRRARGRYVASVVAGLGGVGCGASGHTQSSLDFGDGGTGTRPIVRVDAARDGTVPKAEGGCSGCNPPPVEASVKCTATGGAEVVSARASALGSGLLVDPSALYYVGDGDGGLTLRTVAKDGGADMQLSAMGGPTLAEDNAYVYWGGSTTMSPFTGILRVPKAGGPTEVLTELSEQDPASIAVAGGMVFWAARVHADGSLPVELLELPVDGGTATTLLAEGAGSVGVDTTNVYWTGGSTSSLYTAPLAGGTARLVAQVVALFDVDDEDIYYINIGGSDSSLFAVPKTGGMPVLLAAQVGAGQITHDETFVYWGDGHTMTIYKLPKTGGTPSVVFQGPEVSGGALGVDSACVYFTGSSGSDAPVPLYRAPK